MPSPTTSSTTPRAIAIVLGHLGASKSTLNRYASWYQKRSCVAITGASPPFRFVANLSLDRTAVELWQQTLQALRDTPSTVPVVVHMFSNGGAFVWDAMDRALEEEKDEDVADTGAANTMKLSVTDRTLLKSRLATGYLLFDSCPCYIRLLWDTSTPWASSFPKQGWSPTVRTLYTGMAALSLTTWVTATLSWSRPQQFWNQMTKSTTCLHHIYVYTTADVASDASAVDRLIERRRESCTGTTMQYRYDDSNHVQIDQDHPEEYQRMIDDALTAAVERAATMSTTK